MKMPADRRSLGVLEVGQAGGDVGQPRAPEQVSLLAARRLVGERVEQLVDARSPSSSAAAPPWTAPWPRASALSRAAGPRSRTAAAGCWITGVVSWNSGRDAFSAGASARANGSSSVSVGPSWAAKPLHLAERLVGLRRACPGSSVSPASRLAACEEIAAKFVFDDWISDASWPSTPPSAVATRWRLWIARLRLWLRAESKRRERLRCRGSSGSKRLNVPCSAGDARRLVLERAGAARQQQQQVAPRVAVERGQDLVEIDVRGRAARAQHASVRDGAGLPGARVEREVHVLQRRARAQQHGRVPVDRRVLLEDVHRHHGPPVLELDAPDQADLHAGDRHRLALPGGDRGAGRELGPDRVVALPERERRLVVEDVARRPRVPRRRAPGSR